MTKDGEDTQTERVSGQPVDAKAALWKDDDPSATDEPERGREEAPVTDPAGRREPYVDGPTGPAPLASELRGDPGAEGDRRGEGGAVAGAIAGTSVAGPVGGVVGAVAGGALGSAGDEEPRPDDVEPGSKSEPAERGE